MLEIVGLKKSFGGVQALAGVDVAIDPAAITGVIGPNGSGKTTLFNTIAGAHRPTGGRVTWLGTDITGAPAHRVARLGIVRTFQQAMSFRGLTVGENVRIGFEQGSRAGPRRIASTIPRRFASTGEILAFVGLADLAASDASSLSFGNLRRLGIAVALGAEPSLLLLDEPAAGLNDGESADLAELILTFPKSGIGVCIIDHDMTLMSTLCERLVVLNFGTKIAEGTPDAVLHDARVLDVYLGGAA